MMQKRNWGSNKVQDIILNRVKDRLIDIVLKVENAEVLGRVVKTHFNYLFEIPVFQAIDLGISSGKVLDLGSAYSLSAINLAKQSEDVEIISFQDTRKMINVSKMFAEEDMVEDRIKWEIGKPEKLPFKDNTFDLVISHMDMHHWDDPVAVFNEINRVIRERKGVVVVGDLRRDAYEILWPAIKILSYFSKNSRIFDELKHSFMSSYTKSEVLELLKASNIEKYKVISDATCFYIRKFPEKKRRILIKLSG